ncbi:N-acyl homoserine lactonase family protein [Bradyrhizobium canariense]|uniref:N-acyl homoserine lactonase family protein n=1 Tax=Bradyrhizobium canariense TaxID=255045 RepID=UPI001F0A9B29|nr:N-acyl homoserine lactonase family protein [Bradyrhizobium canariense]
MSILIVSAFSTGRALAGATDENLPDPTTAGFVEKLYRVDCGHSLANDESVWTPGENAGKSIEFSSTCWLIEHKNQWVLWDTGVPQSTLNDRKGWSTLPKLIVYHLDKTITGQLADLGLKINDITYVVLSHTHGDHIGNVGLFANSTIVMQRAEQKWIYSPDGANNNVNQLKALARKLMGKPKDLRLVDGDTDLLGDGSITLVSTPGHTPGSQSLLVHLKNSGFILLSGDVVHLAENFERNIVPSLNTDKAASIASMDKVRRLMATYHAKLFINHDKAQSDMLKLLPAFYD